MLGLDLCGRSGWVAVTRLLARGLVAELVLVAMAACNGPPARIVAGIGDTVVR